MDLDNQMMMGIKREINDLRNEIAVERGRINSLWWKFGIIAGLVSAIAGRVFGDSVSAIVDIILGLGA